MTTKDDKLNKLEQIVLAAKRAGRRLANAPSTAREALLRAMADALENPENRDVLAQANALDMADGEAAQAKGELSAALVARLTLTDRKLDGIAQGLRQLADGRDLIGQTTLARKLDEGLVLRRVSCPLGVLGVVFEARPDAVPQIAGLAMRTGNAVVLKGGSEALRTNTALVELLRRIVEAQGLDPHVIALLTDRADVAALLQQDKYVDLVVARGSTKFIHYVQANSRIPVMGHAEGLCHAFLTRTAKPGLAAPLVVDAKTTYPAACNALETLLWEPGAEVALTACVTALKQAGVALKGCEATRALHDDLEPASDDDWATEYGDLMLSIRKVPDLEAALEHIERYGSKHTEAILTEDDAAAQAFIDAVDAASVFHNASTRFADGYRYGLGAEVGISTSKLHARGPVGVEGLITYRWLLRGDGHLTADYSSGKRTFQHRDLES